MNGNDTGREISFDIVEEIGILTTYNTGWCRELNLVSWNGAAPKYDIRDWSPDHTRMSRGVTFHEKEMRVMLDLMRNRSRRRSYVARRDDVKDAEPETEHDDGMNAAAQATDAAADVMNGATSGATSDAISDATSDEDPVKEEAREAV